MLKLPEYGCKEELSHKLKTAITCGAEWFEFTLAVDNDSIFSLKRFVQFFAQIAFFAFDLFQQCIVCYSRQVIELLPLRISHFYEVLVRKD